ncbi:unnamed protein product, partial [Heterotrigona itama]
CSAKRTITCQIVTKNQDVSNAPDNITPDPAAKPRNSNVRQLQMCSPAQSFPQNLIPNKILTIFYLTQGKPQNKARNIIYKGCITSTIPTTSANRTPSQSDQVNDIKAIDLDHIAYPKMHKQSRKNPSNNTHNHNAHIASSPKPGSSQKALSNYKIHKQDRPPSTNNNPRGGVLIAVHKGISTEDTPQPAISNIEIAIKIETTPKLTVGATYPLSLPSKSK